MLYSTKAVALAVFDCLAEAQKVVVPSDVSSNVFVLKQIGDLFVVIATFLFTPLFREEQATP